MLRSVSAVIDYISDIGPTECPKPSILNLRYISILICRKTVICSLCVEILEKLLKAPQNRMYYFTCSAMQHFKILLLLFCAMTAVHIKCWINTVLKSTTGYTLCLSLSSQYISSANSYIWENLLHCLFVSVNALVELALIYLSFPLAICFQSLFYICHYHLYFTVK